MEKKKDVKHGEAEYENETENQPLTDEPQENPEDKELSELEKVQALAEDYKRKWYSVSAEYDNYRKRNASGISKAYADGTAEAVLKLLPVADNFGYALDSASDEKTKAGIDKVIKSFKTILSSLGVEEIAIEAGSPFNEDEMEAVMSFPCEDGETPNTVKQVLKKGYRQGEKVIRFAQVTVTGE
ncbi:MAG: nucleotide exchange factor GrpE [Clostridia bacterium]|nr:nucleotide exchange factor GrpE [Clostridia bacterium]